MNSQHRSLDLLKSSERGWLAFRLWSWSAWSPCFLWAYSYFPVKEPNSVIVNPSSSHMAIGRATILGLELSDVLKSNGRRWWASIGKVHSYSACNCSSHHVQPRNFKKSMYLFLKCLHCLRVNIRIKSQGTRGWSQSLMKADAST